VPRIIGLFRGSFIEKDLQFKACYEFSPPCRADLLDMYMIQGGEDSQDALICRSFFAKEPLIIGLFCGK